MRPHHVTTTLCLLVLALICTTSTASHAESEADLQRANDLMTAGDLDGAIQAYTAIPTSDPALAAQAMRGMGDCYQRRKDWPKAIECYEKLLASYPNSAAPDKDVKRWIMDCYLWSNQQDKAISLLNSLATENPDDASILHFTVGRYYLWQKKFAEASDEIKKAIDLSKSPADDPLLREMKWKLGDCYTWQRNYDAAISQYRLLLTDHPEDTSALRHAIGKCYLGQKKYPEALAELKSASEQNRLPKEDPSSRALNSRLLTCYLETKDLEGALAQLRKLLADYPDGAMEFVSKQLGKWGDKSPAAVAMVKAAVESAPAEAPYLKELRRALVECSIATWDWDAASAQLKILLSAYPDESASWHSQLGRCYKLQGRWRNAVEEFESALASSKAPASSPEVRSAKKLLLDCYLSGADWQRAASLAESMLRDYPESGTQWQLDLAGAYYELESYDKSIPLCKDLINHCSNQQLTIIAAQVCFAECLFAQGKGPEATAFQKQYYSDHSDRRAERDMVRAKTLYWAADDYAGAAAAFERFIADYPNDPLTITAKRFLIDSLELSGRFAKAAQAIELLLQTAPSVERVDLIERMADDYYKSAKFRESAEAYKTELSAGNLSTDRRAKAFYQLALCYKESGLEGSARRYMLRVSEQFPDSDWAKSARGALFVWDNYGAQTNK